MYQYNHIFVFFTLQAAGTVYIGGRVKLLGIKVEEKLRYFGFSFVLLRLL